MAVVMAAAEVAVTGFREGEGERAAGWATVEEERW